MADVVITKRVLSLKEEFEKEGFGQTHPEWPGYWTKRPVPRENSVHLINLVILEPGARKVHAHEGENVLVIVEGEGEYFLDWDKTVPVKAGDMTYCQGDEVHGILNSSSKPIKYLAIEGPRSFGERSEG